jgi:peptidoglycan/xylan/chitin deacetylase (PgdA/CDA1 family)
MMQASEFSWNHEAFKIGSRILYYSRALKVLNFLSARFQPKKKSEGKFVFPYVQRKKRRNVQILVYHRVNDDGDALFPAVPTVQFARQMEYVSEHCSPCSLEEAVERLARNDLPDNAVAVTFDDGYRDNYVHAFPILQRYGIPATIFLASGAIGSGKMIWHDRVFRAFRKTQVAALDGFSGIEDRLPVRTREERRFAQARVLQLLWQLADEERLDRIERLEERLAIKDEKESVGLMLDWDEILTMAQGGLSFGSHTISHPILSNLPTRRLREEIEESKKVIEGKIHRPVTGFAYPVGRKQDFDDGVKAIVREAGYQYAVTTIFGVNEAGQDPFELRRGTPWETDIPSFAAKLSWYKFVANG